MESSPPPPTLPTLVQASASSESNAPLEIHYEILGADSDRGAPVFLTPRNRQGLEGVRTPAIR